MDVIVLIKLVADIDHIPPDAWDRESGTLRRGRLHLVANPLDDRALRAARDVAHATGGRVVAISMGPRSAEQICRRALAYGADEAILLSDAAFAGADTLATARVLERAIARIVRRTTRRDAMDSPFVFCGMQSPDGDTAQVPAELASMLGVPLLPYVSDLAVVSSSGEPTLEAQVLERRGRATLSILRGPLVLTFTGLAPELPFATTLRAMATATSADVPRWDARQLDLAADAVGLAGSATRVIRIQTVSHSRAGGVTVNVGDCPDPPAAISRLVEHLRRDLRAAARGDAQGDDEAAGEVARDNACAAADGPRREGPEIWTLVELAPGAAEARVEPASLEILGRARELADALGAHVTAVLCGDAPTATLVAELAVRGATRVLVVRRSPGGHTVDVALSHHREATLLAAAARERRPRTILIPATLRGRAISALAAADLGAGLTADCTGLELESPVASRSESRVASPMAAGPPLLQTRPALGGNILATIVSTARDRGLPEMATVRSGVFPVRRFPARRFPTRRREAPHDDGLVEVLELVAGDGAVGFVAARGRHDEPAGSSAGVDPEASVVVAVGAGIGSPERLDQLVRPLVKAVTERLGVTASLACSRAVVDAGILPYEYQIGQTGKSVRPALYIALGISGAIQHRLGMEHSGRTLSVNPDADAPIHAISDYSVVATIEEAVPLLIAALTG